MKKQTGIWLDTKEATLIELADYQTPQIHRIRSGVNTSRPKGGSRSASPWVLTSVISESKILERRKHQEAGYFDKIMEAVREADEVYIFGPAEAKDKLLHAIKENRQHFHPLLRAIETADKMTLNQKAARVREFFEGN